MVEPFLCKWVYHTGILTESSPIYIFTELNSVKDNVHLMVLLIPNGGW